MPTGPGTNKQIKYKSLEEMSRAKTKFCLPMDSNVFVAIEAGRDGFWIPCWFKDLDINCLVADPASIEVNRKAKQAKTDLIDARKLLKLLNDHLDDRNSSSVVQQPPLDAEGSPEARLVPERR